MNFKQKHSLGEPPEKPLKVTLRYPPNPYEGLPIFYEGHPSPYIPIVYESKEAWEKRHPGRVWSEHVHYPDAVRIGPGGRIVPRLKKSSEITFQDLKEWSLLDHGAIILANDRSLKDAFTHH